MGFRRYPLIANRFEIVLLISLGFVIATRLVWLQTDERFLQVSDEFYTTGLSFQQAMQHSCRQGMNNQFPNPENQGDYVPMPNGALSPGLSIVLWTICQGQRLSVEAFMNFAPMIIGATALIVAMTSRLLTSTWVGGFLAASVVLSRGSILQGTHVVSTSFFQQFLMSTVLLFTILYLRTRDARWLPLILCASCAIIIGSPLASLTMFLLAVALFLKAFVQTRRTNSTLKHPLQHTLGSATLALATLALVAAIHQSSPQASSTLLRVLRTLYTSIQDASNLSFFAEGLKALKQELQRQDFHFQTSLAAIAVAGTFRRYLPRGSGACAVLITLFTLQGLLVDSALHPLGSQEIVTETPLSLKLTGAIATIEPALIGIAISYGWLALRMLLIKFIPRYNARSLASR
jgi:hypothetical protein